MVWLIVIILLVFVTYKLLGPIIEIIYNKIRYLVLNTFVGKIILLGGMLCIISLIFGKGNRLFDGILIGFFVLIIILEFIYRKSKRGKRSR
jgi:hypothetical protein